MDIKKVLLVDDEQFFRRIAEIYLSKTGKWSVVVATSGAEALEMAQVEKPDLVLLDSRMPDMDGAATLKRLRENPDTRDIPVIFLSAGEISQECAGTPGVLGIIVKERLNTLVDDIRSLTDNL